MPELMTVKEVAVALKIGQRKVYQLCAERKIPFIKIGDSIRFKREMIENWIESNVVG